MCLTLEALRFAIIFDIAEMKLMGYPRKLLHKIWAAQNLQAMDVDLAHGLIDTPFVNPSLSHLASILTQAEESVATLGRHGC